jgi:hypothetical protein
MTFGNPAAISSVELARRLGKTKSPTSFSTDGFEGRLTAIYCRNFLLISSRSSADSASLNAQLMALCEATISLYGINSANKGKMGCWQWNGFFN